MGVKTPKNYTMLNEQAVHPPQCLYLLATTANHPTRLQSSSTLLSETDNSYFLQLLHSTL